MVTKTIDKRTGFPMGYHGGYSHALDYALDVYPNDPRGDGDGIIFLRAWREGDLEEWPEYYDWLRSIGVTG